VAKSSGVHSQGWLGESSPAPGRCSVPGQAADASPGHTRLLVPQFGMTELEALDAQLMTLARATVNEILMYRCTRLRGPPQAADRARCTIQAVTDG
jgi:hypothetical protein